ncbi:MAG TPA: NAD(P)/FAD-dependent oxidoreductase [Gammaproteobacteria bacterium]|nr:NAD(P)/FAD-dependent oxidoreductase [Gammaproteobacteria bacterium]
MDAPQLLFSTGKIGGLTIKNRLLMAPMVRNYADERGHMTPRYLAHIQRIARGGVGAMILEASYVSRDGRGFRNELGLHDDSVIPGLRQAVELVHAQDARLGIQLYHAGRQTSMQVTGEQPVAPSAMPCPLMNELPRALNLAEIRRLVDAFGAAAARAQAAGLDFVEIHAAHGYLITQFLSPFSNRRTDGYGGSLEHRRRFLDEVISAVRARVGEDFPVTIRLSADEMVPGGLTPADTAELAAWLEGRGIAAIHVSVGNYASYTRGYMIPPMAMEDAPLVKYAALIRERVKIPVIAVGKLRTPALAEAVLANGQADFVALGRELLADPDWPIKAQSGAAETIHKCIACNQGCISRLFDQRDVWCTVNPECGREREFAEHMKARKPYKLLIVGGGPAGMEAARYAAGAGLQVILCEAQAQLGGQLRAAGAAPYRPGWHQLQEGLQSSLQRLGVEVRLNTRVDRKYVEREKPFALVIASGAQPVRPQIPGVNDMYVLTARDVLEGHSTAVGSVLVAGGGCSGAQTAEYLARAGHTVTLIEAEGDIAADAPLDDRTLLIGRLCALKVNILSHTRLISIENQVVHLDVDGETSQMAFDTVVLCLGARSENKLEKDVLGLVPHVFTVGDAVRPRKVTEAVIEGALAGLGVAKDSNREDTALAANA